MLRGALGMLRGGPAPEEEGGRDRVSVTVLAAPRLLLKGP